MTYAVERAGLLGFLKARNVQYFGKALELREAVAGWLSYTVATFPHYTRHTVEHSEEIIFQISKVLFRNDDIEDITLPTLSPTEAYILIAAAYLHDSGMVVSDQEKEETLSSAAWAEWSLKEVNHARLQKVAEFRNGVQPADGLIRSFLADVELRRLIAEFFRQHHHLRAADVVRQHQGVLGRFAFDDPILQRTISDVCIGHGLERRDIEDVSRYPLQRDIRHDKVNVRLMAILLRLGDLLDMSHERACPLLLSVASPLPKESLPHWSQYSCIEHLSISPERIELRACCKTQDEHRTLFDWCKWIQEETEFALSAMAQSPRHSGWKPPFAKIVGSGDGTIDIRPAASARYVFRSWRFEIDQAQILKLLADDLYSNPLAYLRELIQNSLDATRCRMQVDLQTLGASFRPELVDAAHLMNYPIHVEIKNTGGSGGQVVSVDDFGVGMTQEVIERYFLQVGRSFYSSPEFKRQYGFFPMSGFGIGFLSVFSASENVKVETLHLAESGDSIVFSMTGPRSYLLTERGSRRVPGTRIEMTLRRGAELEPGQLTKYLKHLCKRVEVPVKVNDFGMTLEIEAETPESFIGVRDSMEQGQRIEIKSFPFEVDGHRGEIYLRCAADGVSEDWTFNSRLYEYQTMYPHAEIPAVPPDMFSNRGLDVGEVGGMARPEKVFSCRVDYRGDRQLVDLSRTRRKGSVRFAAGAIVRGRLNSLLSDHMQQRRFASDDEKARYANLLSSEFDAVDFLADIDRLYGVYDHSGARRLVGEELWECQHFFLLFHADEQRYYPRRPKKLSALPEGVAITSGCFAMVSSDLEMTHRGFMSRLFGKFDIYRVSSPSKDVICFEMARMESARARGRFTLVPIEVPLGDGHLWATTPYRFMRSSTLGDAPLLMSTRSEFARWLVHQLRNAKTNDARFSRLVDLVANSIRYEDYKSLLAFIDNWNAPLSPDDPLRAPALRTDQAA